MSIEEADKVVRQLWDADVNAWETHWAPLFRKFALDLVSDARVCPGHVVLDVGTGTGVAAFEAATHTMPGGFVVGIDRSKPMLTAAKADAEKSGRKNLRFHTMEAEHLQFPDRLFDATISNCGISYATFHQTIVEVFRVLRRGGVFTFNDWRLKDVPAHKMLGSILEQYRTDNPSRKLLLQRTAVATLERFGNRKMNLKVQVNELRLAGFARVHVKRRKYTIILNSVQQYLDMRFTRVALKQELAELSETRRAKLLRELRKGLREFVRGKRFKLDWDVSYVHAKKP